MHNAIEYSKKKCVCVCCRGSAPARGLLVQFLVYNFNLNHVCVCGLFIAFREV